MLDAATDAEVMLDLIVESVEAVVVAIVVVVIQWVDNHFQELAVVVHWICNSRRPARRRCHHSIGRELCILESSEWNMYVQYQPLVIVELVVG